MSKQLSQVAQVAQLIKADLKAMGIKATAKSSSFSMGDSVRVKIENVAPKLAEELKTKYSQYEYGSFNGMEDIYEMNNCRDDIPQTKYLSIDIGFSADIQQAAFNICKNKYQLFEGMTGEYTQLMTWEQSRVFNDLLYTDDNNELWPNIENQQKKSTVKTKAVKTVKTSVDKVTVKINEELQGIEIYFPNKPDNQTRSDLKLNGFRWSRFNGCWYTKQSGIAETFANLLVTRA